MNNAGEKVTLPGLGSVVRGLKSDIFKSLNCVKIGEIVSFDVSKKTATIQILFKRVLPDNSIQSHPLLVDCPVVTIQGGGGAIEFPITAGDQCLVFFADRNIDAWFKAGGEAAPFDGRAHDLSDGIALVGVNALNGTLSDYVASAARFFFDGAEIQLKGGKVVVKNGTTDLYTLINSFFTQLEAIQVNLTTGLLQASSITALETVKTQILALVSAP